MAITGHHSKNGVPSIDQERKLTEMLQLTQVSKGMMKTMTKRGNCQPKKKY